MSWSGRDPEDVNRDVVLAYFDRCWDQGDLAFGRTIIPDDYVLHVPPGVPNGFAGWRTGVEHFRSLFEGIRFEHTHVVAEGDLVMVRSTVRGRHVGEILGVPGTGREVVFDVVDTYRLAGGLLVEHWDVVDFFSLLCQIGGVPATLRLPGVPA